MLIGGMLICTAKMTEDNPTSQYALGSTDVEHERLIRQARWLAAHTERLFREVSWISAPALETWL